MPPQQTSIISTYSIPTRSSMLVMTLHETLPAPSPRVLTSQTSSELTSTLPPLSDGRTRPSLPATACFPTPPPSAPPSCQMHSSTILRGPLWTPLVPPPPLISDTSPNLRWLHPMYRLHPLLETICWIRLFLYSARFALSESWITMTLATASFLSAPAVINPSGP